jgi:hypothetical protein
LLVACYVHMGSPSQLAGLRMSGRLVFTSHRLTQHHVTPHHITPHRIASHRIASHRIAAHRIAPPRTVPAPPRSTPLRAPLRCRLRRCASRHVASRHVASLHPSSSGVAPGAPCELSQADAVPTIGRNAASPVSMRPSAHSIVEPAAPRGLGGQRGLQVMADWRLGVLGPLLAVPPRAVARRRAPQKPPLPPHSFRGSAPH